MADQALEPLQLVVELRPRLRIAVGQVQAADDDPVHRSLDVAAMRVVGIARQAAPAFDRLASVGEDRDPVPGRLPVPDRAVARPFDLGDRECGIRRFEFLQAGDVRLFLLQPRQQRGQARADAVDVEGGEFDGIAPLACVAIVCRGFVDAG